MPSSKFVVESRIKPSFRTEKVKGMFDISFDTVKKEFDVDIPIEDKPWNIGLIVGASGSGKTTIAKNVFKDYELFTGFKWSNNAVVDDFKDSLSAKQITESLSKVGFSSPPDWLKPFAVLSNGQKMRAELARLILESDKPVIYDEFTSVVDRNVAKIGSAAIQKYIRKEDKQFIAVSCHYDIIEWLQPDWVYDCNSHIFKRRSLRRPEIAVHVRKAEQAEWEMQRKSYTRQDGTIMNVAQVCIDSGGHFTDEVYAYCKKQGVDWVIPIKGSSQAGRPVATFPKTKNKRGIYLTMVGTDTAKELVYQRYRILEPGQGYCHWPVKDCFDEDYFKQATAEEKLKKFKNGVPFFSWDAKNRRNEALDCRVYSLAAIRILPQHRGINLEQLAEGRSAPDDLPATAITEEQHPSQRPTRRTFRSSYLQYSSESKN